MALPIHQRIGIPSDKHCEICTNPLWGQPLVEHAHPQQPNQRIDAVCQKCFDDWHREDISRFRCHACRNILLISPEAESRVSFKEAKKLVVQAMGACKRAAMAAQDNELVTAANNCINQVSSIFFCRRNVAFLQEELLPSLMSSVSDLVANAQQAQADLQQAQADLQQAQMTLQLAVDRFQGVRIFRNIYAMANVVSLIVVCVLDYFRFTAIFKIVRVGAFLAYGMKVAQPHVSWRARCAVIGDVALLGISMLAFSYGLTGLFWISYFGRSFFFAYSYRVEEQQGDVEAGSFFSRSDFNPWLQQGDVEAGSFFSRSDFNPWLQHKIPFLVSAAAAVLRPSVR